MGTVHQIQPESQEKSQEYELTERFRSWWKRQDIQTRQAIREIVTDDHKPGTREDAIEVLTFLNLKTGKNFRPVPANLDRIRARLREATVQECKAVIAMKCREWRDDEHMRAYLRPATLFAREKFEQYMGEVGGE